MTLQSKTNEKNLQKSTPTISVILPTYNEKQNIVQVIEECITSLKEYRASLEIIIIDDDSPDGTASIVKKNYKDNEQIRVIQRLDKKGLGTAIARGFKESRGKIITVCDSDLQHPPEVLVNLIETIKKEDVDIAIGSRYLKKGGIENWSIKRKIVSFGADRLARILVPNTRNLSDPMSGVFALKKEVIENIELSPIGYKILIEILSKGNCDDIKEVPYLFKSRNKGKSKLTWKEYLNYLEHIIQLRINSIHSGLDSKRISKSIEFAGIGAIGVLINMIIFFTGIQGGLSYLYSGVLAFFFAVTSNFIGNWFVTFNRSNGPLIQQFIKYNIISGTGFLIYILVLSSVIEILQFPILLANLSAIGGSTIWNFIGSEKFAFRVK